MIQESIEKMNRDSEQNALIETACRDLLTYGVWDGKMKIKGFVKKYLLRQQIATESLICWPTAFLAAGLWEHRQENEQMIDSALHVYYKRWMDRGCPITVPDDLMAGEVLLSMIEAYRAKAQDGGIMDVQELKKYEKEAGKLAEYGLSYPVDELGSLPYRASQKNGMILVDTIGLVCPFLYRYGVMYDRKDAMELAVKQIVNFLAYGMDVSTGLPYHGYIVVKPYKCGIIGWGRAVGWLLRGMTGCMITGYGADKFTNDYRQLVDAVLSYQREDGYFAWQLSAKEGPADTSATGMICASLKQGIELGIITQEKYGQALQAGRNAIAKSIRNGRVYDCSGECEGPGQYPQRYDAYPWALGPALML